MKSTKYKSKYAKMIAAEIKKGSNRLILEALTNLHNFILNLEEGYSSSSKKLSWENVDKAIDFIKSVLMDDWGLRNYDKDDKKYIEYLSQKHFNKFIEFVFEERNWEETYYYIFNVEMSMMFLFFFPDKILQKIKLPIKLLMEVNLSIERQWEIQKSFSIIDSVKREYKNSQFIQNMLVYQMIMQSLRDDSKIKNYTSKHRRIISYSELNDQMKDRLEFWKNLLNQDNYKMTPNKKYSDEMFAYTSQMRFEGYKAYIACIKTLEKFKLDPAKDESYAKQYRDHLKKQKINVSKK